MIKNSKLKTQNSKRGFTLIELLVVVSIIGILASLLLARYGTAEKSARDAQRKSDLNQYRIALENFAAVKGGTYPARTAAAGVRASTTLCTDLGTTYISVCLEDPRYGTTGFEYKYQSNGTNGETDATQHILWAKMETVKYWYVCANGKSSEKATTPAKSDCGF